MHTCMCTCTPAHVNKETCRHMGTTAEQRYIVTNRPVDLQTHRHTGIRRIYIPTVTLAYRQTERERERERERETHTPRPDT